MKDLKQVIGEVISRIKENRPAYEKNEEQTRAGLINPVLKSLGWDYENPKEVCLNATDEAKKIPDYCLKLNGKKMLIIEAKSLGQEIAQEEKYNQLCEYCSHEGVDLGMLTNGRKYMLFKGYEKGTSFKDREIWRTDLESDDISIVSRWLSTISKENVKQLPDIMKKRRKLQKTWDLLMNDPEEVLDTVTDVLKGLIINKLQKYNVDDDIKSFLHDKLREEFKFAPPPAGDGPNPPNKPGQVTIGKETFPINKHNEILIKTAEWLINEGKLKKSDCPLGTNPLGVKGSRYLINYEPKHKNGKDFINPRQLSNGLYAELSHDAEGCERCARLLFKKFGYPSDFLKVK